MTFLFRLDVCACGSGGNEGFSHSVFACVCVSVCVHMHKLDRVNAQTITIQPLSVAFVLVYNIV